MLDELEGLEVRDVTEWKVVEVEPRGKRSKAWVEDPSGHRWLRKLPRETRPSEPVVEALALRLARASSLEAPESHLCVWRESDGERRGLVVRSFTAQESDLSLIEGYEVLKGRLDGYDPEYRAGHRLKGIYKVLKSYEKELQQKPALRKGFLRMLLFDAWVGNGDRHPENWAILRADSGAVRLAPVFDMGACLGAELHDGAQLLDPLKRTDERLRKYVEECPSGFGNGDRLMLQAEVIECARRWEGWRETVAELVPRFGTLWGGQVWECLSALPPDWLSVERRALIKELLAHRLAWLRRMV